MAMRATLIIGLIGMASAAQISHAGSPAAVFSASATASFVGPYGEQTTFSRTATAIGADIMGSVPFSNVSASSDPGIPELAVSGESLATPGYGNNYGNGTSASESLSYFYQVVGATEATPVDVSYKLQAKSSSTGYYGQNTGASAELDELVNDSAGAHYDQQLQTSQVDNRTLVQGTFFTHVAPGYANEIDLLVNEFTENGLGSYSSAQASADPRIFIDPGYLAAHPGLQLEISPGIGNIGPSAVPEPAIWVSIIFGLAMTGAAMRTRRRHNRVLA